MRYYIKSCKICDCVDVYHNEGLSIGETRLEMILKLSCACSTDSKKLSQLRLLMASQPPPARGSKFAFSKGAEVREQVRGIV